jgi:polyhydroxyalkanoate synthase
MNAPESMPPRPSAAAGFPPVADLGVAFGDLLQRFGKVHLAPDGVSRLQAEYVEQAKALWDEALAPPAAAAPLKDRRFAAPVWQEQAHARFAASLYLLNARTLSRMADLLEGDEKTRERIRFAVRQFVDATSPSNYLPLNPEALQKAVETQGRSLMAGLQHLLHDVRQGHVSQTDETVFEVGRNVATTEGQVVFENELLQLIEYRPLTDTVHERPILFVPPCINKYYILDLQPENSLIRYCVAEGHRTFVVSWRNPDDSLADKGWDDYIEDGVLRAIQVVQSISRQERINTLGFCVGGTLLATALAVQEARGERPAESLTLLTTFLDFSDTGVIDVFVDETAVKLRELTIGAQAPTGPALLRGQELASTFSFLRPNELVWNYVVGNYLKGETPPPFDLLFWNSDATNLPGPMFCWYLRHTYLEDRLKEPGALQVCGVPLDLGRLNLPTYVYASREDHIVPWHSAYRSTTVLKDADCRFVLGASGHIAGVINPPAKGKRSHWLWPADRPLPATPSDWLAGAEERPGSWWPDWSAWLSRQAGPRVKAPTSFGSRVYKPIEPAPGRYVRQRA